MAQTPWQQRIRRAEYLAKEHPCAKEVLGFYIHAAHFQEQIYLRLKRVAAASSAGSSSPAEWASRPLPVLPDEAAAAEFLASFPPFLSLVEGHGPPRLAQVAQNLHNSDHDSWAVLFTECWTRIDSPTDPKEFLALTFLQPFAEFARSQSDVQVEGYTRPLCPFCNRKPALGVLRQQGDGGRRSLLCGFCLTEWEYRRVVCPGCGEEDHARLPVYTAAELPYIRVECCDTCKTYIKSIDLTKNGLADPLVDELASIPLSLWAQEHGYAKLHPNLFGI